MVEAHGAEPAWSSLAGGHLTTPPHAEKGALGGEGVADGDFLSGAPTMVSKASVSEDEDASPAPGRGAARARNDGAVSDRDGGDDETDSDDESDGDGDLSAGARRRGSVRIYAPDEPHPWLLADDHHAAFRIRPKPVLACRLFAGTAGAGRCESLAQERANSMSALSSLLCGSMLLPQGSVSLRVPGLTHESPVNREGDAATRGTDETPWAHEHGSHDRPKSRAALPFRGEWELMHLLKSPHAQQNLLDRVKSARAHRWEHTPRSTV